MRLGLVLGKLGEQNGITIAGDEVQRAIMARARQFPGQEQQVFQYYANNPQAQAEIRAPLFEDKVVDFIAELAQVTDKQVDRETLFTDPDDAVQSGQASRTPESSKLPAAERYIKRGGACKTVGLSSSNQKARLMANPDGILQQHPGADGGRTDRPRRARLSTSIRAC